jgi:uncharacterized protein YkwD
MELTKLRSLLIGTLLSTLLVAAPAEAASGRQAASCSNTCAIPAEGKLAEVKRATLCLLNAERAERDLRPLARNGRLAKAADRHVEDMFEHTYFAHDSRNGDSFSDRIRATGYLSRVSTGAVGENLA